MILGIMQPYFFPYLGYFDLINCVDRWIVFDTPQYIRHGWINRNRILHPQRGWQYLTVPLQKHKQTTRIMDVRISTREKWQDRMMGQIQHYRQRAPFFAETIGLVDTSIRLATESICQLNVHILGAICGVLGIGFEPLFFSEMGLHVGDVKGPGDWALHIASALGATGYVNPPGGESLFEKDRFQAEGIKLSIRRFPTFTYSCPGYVFEPDLSVIDVLMWNPIADVRKFLEQQRSSFRSELT